MSLTKMLTYKRGNPGNSRNLLVALTGVAAINKFSTTVHSGLSINVGVKMYPLNDR